VGRGRSVCSTCGEALIKTERPRSPAPDKPHPRRPCPSKSEPHLTPTNVQQLPWAEAVQFVAPAVRWHPGLPSPSPALAPACRDPTYSYKAWAMVHFEAVQQLPWAEAVQFVAPAVSH
jgi:hypothetical protein